MNAHIGEIAELEEQLTAKSAKLSQSSAKHGVLADNLSRVILQYVAGATVSDNSKLVGGSEL